MHVVVVAAWKQEKEEGSVTTTFLVSGNTCSWNMCKLLPKNGSGDAL